MSECEHNYQFQGTVYGYYSHPMAGSGAHERWYKDRYFCTKCLSIRDLNQRDQGNSYSKPIEGTVPV